MAAGVAPTPLVPDAESLRTSNTSVALLDAQVVASPTPACAGRALALAPSWTE